MSSRGPRPGLPMIAGPSIINGGTFIQHTTNDGRKSPFDILREAVAHTAFYDSGAVFDRPKCHPNTRLAVLNKIMIWARRADEEILDRYIMWLTGAAGAGKSAIAQSFIEGSLLRYPELVIASFFFGRSDGTRNHAGALVATLVYQIGRAVPAVRKEILSVIENDPFILTKGLDQQFTNLLARPLHNACYMGTSSPLENCRVIVIDGLDECLNGEAQQQILRIMSSTIREYKLPILFLIASRPEHQINITFGSEEMDGTFTRLYLDDSFHPDDDIRFFLRESFAEIKRTHPFRSSIPMAWPTPEATECIVRKSSGQFIYAVTVVKYVKSIRHRPHHQLEKILNLRPLQGDSPFAQLDELYTMILSSATEIEQVLFAISAYSLNIANSTLKLDLEHYMSLDKEEIEILFCDLGALVSVEWSNGTTLKILHASLHDFLLDPMRSKEYFIDNVAYRTAHIITILQYIAPTPSEIEDHNARHIDIRMAGIHDFFSKNVSMCALSTELVNQAYSFPLEEVLGMQWRWDKYRRFFFLGFGFFPLIRRMARLDPQWSLLEARTQDAFDDFILSKMPWYYKAKNRTAALCLVYHLGQEEYVPGFITRNNGGSIQIHHNCNNGPILMHGEDDLLCLERIDFRNIGTDEDRYRQCVVSFLQDSGRSGSYAIGPETYIKATEFFIDGICNLRWDNQVKYNTLIGFKETESISSKEEESSHRNMEVYLSSQLQKHDSLWVLNTSQLFSIKEHHLAFLYLGYIIFFLPLCGKSKELLEQCQRPRFFVYFIVKFFPMRTALLRQAMQDYLDRFGEESGI